MESLPATQANSLLKQPAGADLVKRINLNPLTEFTVSLNPELGQMEMQIVHANRCFPKAYECEKKLFVKELEKLINKSYRDTGYKFPEDTDAATLTLDVAQDIFTEFKTLTLPEIQIAFHKGVREPFPYGEIIGLSTANFYKMLYGYQTQTRVQNLIKQRKFENDQEIKAKEWKPTHEEEKVIMFYSIVNLIKDVYAKNQITLDNRNMFYKALLGLKIITPIPNDEYREKIRQQAIKQLSEHINLQITATKGTLQKQTLRAQLTSIVNAQDFDKGDEQIAAQAKLIHANNCIKEFIKGRKEEVVLSEIHTKMLGKLSGDQLIWEAWRLKIRKPNELFKTKKQHDDFLIRTEKLRKEKLMRP